MFIAVLLTRAKAWKEPKCASTEEWIKKIGDTYIYKECNNVIHSNMDRPRNDHTK